MFSSTQVQIPPKLPSLCLKIPSPSQCKVEQVILTDQSGKATSWLALTWLQDYNLTMIQRSSHPLALPRLNPSPRFCIQSPPEQLHTTFHQCCETVPRQIQNKHNKAQTPGSDRPFSSKLADAEGWHLFLINNILPVTMRAVPIDIPNGFQPFWPLHLTHFSLRLIKPKIKLVIISQVLSCTPVTSTQTIFLLFKCSCKSVISLKPVAFIHQWGETAFSLVGMFFFPAPASHLLTEGAMQISNSNGSPY